MTEAYVKSELNDGLRTIEFFHPSHNSLPSNILSDLANAITAAGNDNETKVILLKSGGDRTFCAGASFDELVNIIDLETGKKFFMGFANVINACRKCPKIIVGRVQGKAVGGGVGVASAVDYCMATKFASIKLSELAVGIGPFVVGPAVQRKVGLSAFSQLAINASEFHTADWAKQNGVFAEVYEDAQALDNAIKIFIEKLLSYSPEAQAGIKKITWENCEDWDELLEKRAAISGELVLSDFTKTALAKYK